MSVCLLNKGVDCDIYDLALARNRDLVRTSQAYAADTVNAYVVACRTLV